MHVIASLPRAGGQGQPWTNTSPLFKTLLMCRCSGAAVTRVCKSLWRSPSRWRWVEFGEGQKRRVNLGKKDFEGHVKQEVEFWIPKTSASSVWHRLNLCSHYLYLFIYFSKKPSKHSWTKVGGLFFFPYP